MKSEIGEMTGIEVHMKNCSWRNKIPVQASDIHGNTYIWMMNICRIFIVILISSLYTQTKMTKVFKVRAEFTVQSLLGK